MGASRGGPGERAVRMRFGLLGTGHSAAETHGAALAAHPDANWPGSGAATRQGGGTGRQLRHPRRTPDADALIADVDAVAVALPPDVQSASPSAPPRPAATAAGQAGGLHHRCRRPDRDRRRASAASPRWSSSPGASPRAVAVVPRPGRGGRGLVRRPRRLARLASSRSGSPYGGSPWRRESGGAVGRRPARPVPAAAGPGPGGRGHRPRRTARRRARTAAAPLRRGRHPRAHARRPARRRRIRLRLLRGTGTAEVPDPEPRRWRRSPRPSTGCC